MVGRENSSTPGSLVRTPITDGTRSVRRIGVRPGGVWIIGARPQTGRDDVLAEALDGVVPPDVLAGRRRHPDETRLVGERGDESSGESRAFHGVVEAMNTLLQGRVPSNRRIVHHGHRPAERRLVVTEAVPAVALGRPGEP